MGVYLEYNSDKVKMTEKEEEKLFKSEGFFNLSKMYHNKLKNKPFYSY